MCTEARHSCRRPTRGGTAPELGSWLIVATLRQQDKVPSPHTAEHTVLLYRYLVSIITDGSLLVAYVLNIATVAGSDTTSSLSTLTPVVAPGTTAPTDPERFGAGWTYGGKIFFAANDGLDGVYELEFTAALFAAGSFGFRNIGDSAETDKNDGANCPGAPIPFPTCGNKDATSGVAVTDAECGTGYIYDATAATSVCDDAAVGCDVSTVGAGDHNR